MRPRADNATDEGKRLNRRINAVIPCFSDLAGLAVIAARFTIASAIDFFDQSDTAALHLAGIGF
jgi:OOP family OmpA-OmpF porin